MSSSTENTSQNLTLIEEEITGDDITLLKRLGGKEDATPLSIATAISTESLMLSESLANDILPILSSMQSQVEELAMQLRSYEAQNLQYRDLLQKQYSMITHYQQQLHLMKQQQNTTPPTPSPPIISPTQSPLSPRRHSLNTTKDLSESSLSPEAKKLPSFCLSPESQRTRNGSIGIVDIQTLKLQLNNEQVARQKAEKEKLQLQQMLRDQEQTMTKIRKEQTSMEQRLKTMDKENTELKSQLQQGEKNSFKLQEQLLKISQAHKREVDRLLSEKQNEIQAQEKQFIDAQKNSKKDLERIQKERAKLEEAAKQDSKTITALRRQVTELESEKKELQKAMRTNVRAMSRQPSVQQVQQQQQQQQGTIPSLAPQGAATDSPRRRSHTVGPIQRPSQ